MDDHPLRRRPITSPEVAVDEGGHTEARSLPSTSMVLTPAQWNALVTELDLEPSVFPTLERALSQFAVLPPFVDDLCLAMCAAMGFGRAVRVFDERCVQPTAAVLRRLVGESELEDLMQEVRARLLAGPDPRLLTFRGECPLGAWVRAVAVRVAINRRSSRPSPTLQDDALHELAAPVDVALDVARNQHRARFQAALCAAMAALTPRERALLRLHYLQGVRLEKLAVMHGCHRATVVRWLSSARDLVFAETRRRLETELSLSAHELDSLLRDAREQLTISIASLEASRAA